VTGNYRPTAADPAGVWSPWVASRPTVEARREALAQVPEPIRKVVEAHVRTVFAIRAFHARKRRGK
jgi:hypothetical protein